MSGSTGIDLSAVVHARVSPKGVLDNLSQQEVDKLLDRGQGGLYPLFRRCALAVLNSGTLIDDARLIFDAYKDFELRIVREPWGIKLELQHAPAQRLRRRRDHPRRHRAAVRGRARHRLHRQRDRQRRIRPRRSRDGITDAVFDILRNARVPAPARRAEPGGVLGRPLDQPRRIRLHQAGRLRARPARPRHLHRLRPGRDEGPDEGRDDRPRQAALAATRYIGITEPGIIAAESPNPIVNHLVIMPDIEKRLEAFVRIGHGIIVFPGGVGTAEEILYLLGILLHPDNADLPFPLIFTGPTRSARRTSSRSTVPAPDAGRGRHASATRSSSTIRPRSRAQMAAAASKVREQLAATRRDSFFFNWSLKIAAGVPAAVRARPTRRWPRSNLHRDQPVARARRRPAPRVLRHRRRQRQGRGHAPDRGSTARSRSTATRHHAGRWMRCCARSSSSAA